MNPGAKVFSFDETAARVKICSLFMIIILKQLAVCVLLFVVLPVVFWGLVYAAFLALRAFFQGLAKKGR